MKLVDEMGPELVTTSRCAARASFEADVSDALGEDTGGEMTFRVSSASGGGCSGGRKDHKRNYYSNKDSPGRLETVH